MITIDNILANLNNGYIQVTDLFINKYNFANEPVYYTSPQTGNFNYYGWADAVFIQSDGKVLVGGSSGLYDNSLDNYSVVKRFNPNGTPDNTFISAKFNGNYNGYIRDIGQQSDGKLIVVGHFTNVDGNSVNRIARLNTNGTFDNTFAYASGFNNNVLVCNVLSDDSILVGGSFSNYDGYGNSRLLKLNSDGTLDTAFADNVSINGNVHAIAIDGDGNIYVGGNFGNRIIKLNSDGTTDGSFDPGGGFNDRVTAIALQDNGQIIVGGWFDYYDGNVCNSLIVRLNTDGGLDNSFYGNGSGLNDWNGLGVQALAIQADGKIVAGGWFIGYNDSVQRSLVRLYDDGTRDESFDIGTGFSDRVQDVKIDSNGNIYCAGFFYFYDGKPCTTEFNYLDQYQSGGVAKLDTNAALLGNPQHQIISPIGIDDGNRDMFDSGLYINTNKSQPYATGINNSSSLPFTHSVLNFSDSSEGIDFTTYDISIDNYSFDATSMDGLVKNGDSFFGVGSKYFTNMYPGLFVMCADKVKIHEFSVIGNIGQDGNGDYASGKFDVVFNNKTYGVFYKSLYDNNDSDETNIQQIVIIDRKSGGTQQRFFNPLNNLAQVITELSGVSKIFMLIFASNDISNSYTELQIENIVKKFLSIALEVNVTNRPLSPRLSVRVKTYDPLKLQTQALPDVNRENIVNQLKNQTVYLPNWPYPLKDGDQITIYGQKAIQLYNDIRFLNNGEFNVVEVLYYGPDFPQQKITYIFINPDYVDYTSDPGSSYTHEANNLMFFMDDIGYEYNTFNLNSDISWENVCSLASTIIIPEIEEADLYPDLSSQSKSKINEFVLNGGKLIMFYPSSDVINILNNTFGFSMSGEGGISTPISVTSEGNALFSGLNATIPDNNGSDSIQTDTLPANSITIYEGSDPNQSLVVQISYGTGKIYVFGWDWYDAVPQGDQDGGWLYLLQKILES